MIENRDKISNQAVDDSLVAAREFWNSELRSRQERKELASQRDRLWWTQTIAIGTVLLAALVMLGTRMFMLSRHRQQLESEVKKKTSSLEEAKREAEEARDAAEKADRAKSDFLACINHELRNPLNAILGYCQLIKQRTTGQPDFDFGDEFRGLESSSEHLLRLVNNVLDMSTIEHGETELQERKFDLPELCRAVNDILVPAATAKQIEFSCVIDSELPRFTIGDDSKLRQILINLGTNAINFTAEGAVSVDVSSRKVRDRIVLDAKVADTGCGIPDNELASVFSPFMQSEEARRNRVGTGLGLYIGKSFAERMGGSLTVTSTVGRGSTFHLQLPLRTPVEASGEDSWNDSIGSTFGVAAKRVLVVDDQLDNLKVIAKLLSMLGHATRTASSKQEALEQVAAWSPDVIFLDIHMPDADGFEVAGAIRNRKLNKKPYIVALTGDAMAAVREKSLDCGFDAFLSKPVRARTMARTIEQLTAA